MTSDLFDPNRQMMTKASMKERAREKRKAPKRRGYAWRPGTGPAGETCSTCVFREGGKNYNGNKHWNKCWLVRDNWTHSYGTDILAKAPACKFWRAIPDALKAIWKKLRKLYADKADNWKECAAVRTEAENMEKAARA